VSDENYDDPHAVVLAWAERMTLRWGPKVWDQKRRDETTWIGALSRHRRGPEHKWIEAPVWSNADVVDALAWERETYPECVYWPLWVQPWSKKDKRPCKAQDHKWGVTIEEGRLYLHCKDPCEAGENCTAEYISGPEQSRDSYVLGACVDIEDRWDLIQQYVTGEFTVKLSEHHEGSDYWSGTEAYSEFVLEPVFHPKSYVCGHCGSEAPRHRHAISRYEKGVRLCSECGRKEAMKAFQLPNMEEADGNNSGDRAEPGGTGAGVVEPLDAGHTAEGEAVSGASREVASVEG
jgi:hypothetical protein